MIGLTCSWQQGTPSHIKQSFLQLAQKVIALKQKCSLGSSVVNFIHESKNALKGKAFLLMHLNFQISKLNFGHFYLRHLLQVKYETLFN